MKEEDFKINNNIDIKSKNNFRNFSYSNKDQYYRKAKEEGFRARSVYKLKEIEQNFNLIMDSKNILDLCAAPGSWSQMLRSFSDINTRICSVDLQAIVPIEGVHTIQGDITKQSTLEEILKYFGNEEVDLIVMDGAPDVTGIIELDINMQTHLISCSLIMCVKVLKNGGKFVAKVFKSDDHDFYSDKAKRIFKYVTFYKPSSSRLTSHETFLVCEGFNLNDDEIKKECQNITLEDIFALYNNNFSQESLDNFCKLYSTKTADLFKDIFLIYNIDNTDD